MTNRFLRMLGIGAALAIAPSILFADAPASQPATTMPATTQLSGKALGRIPPPLGAWKTDKSLSYARLLPADQKEWDATFDKRNIRESAAMQTDRSEAMLAVPADLKDPRDFDVAKVAPQIDFAIVQNLDPAHLPKEHFPREFPVWGGWGEVRCGPDGCFYYSLGNHAAFNGDALLLRYNPKTKVQDAFFSIKKLIGTTPDQFADSKLHGVPDISPEGEYWGLTFWSLPPTQEEADSYYRGSWLLHANVNSGAVERVCVPVEGETWAHHVWDWKHGFLMSGATATRTLLVYDTNERRIHYAGRAPAGMHFYEHSLFVDRETGVFYGSEVPEDFNIYKPDKTPKAVLSYRPRNNVFTRTKMTVPANPVTGAVSTIAGAAPRRDRNGNLWCIALNGVLIRFDPAKEAMEGVATDWGSGRYTMNLTISPDGRYLYYVPGSDTQAYSYGTPVMQFDIATGKKKVIAFLNDYYLEKYGYSPGGTYGCSVDEKGESLFFYVNGHFKDAGRATSYGRPAIFHVHIPAEERPQ